MSGEDSTLKQDILEALEKERNRLNGKKELTPEEDNTWANVVNFITILEGALCVCFTFGVFKGLEMNDSALVLFHSMLALGFGSVFLLSLKPWANA